MRKIAAVLFLAVLVLADTLTVDDLLNLKQAGFSDAEIRKEIERTQTRLSIGEDDAKRLTAAGFDEAFVASLKGAGALTLAEIRAMHGRGDSAERIITAIARAAKRPQVGASGALELTRAGVPATVVRALKAAPLTKTELIALARGGAGEGALVALVRAVGTAFKPGAGEALELIRAGVPSNLVRELREGRAAPRTAREPGVYEHPAGRFGLRHPPKWRRLVHVAKTDFMAEYIFTPDAVADPKKVRRGFAVTPLAVVEDNQFRTLPIADVMRKLLPVIRTEEPGLKVRSGTKVEPGKLAGEPAAFVQFEGTFKERDGGPYRVHFGVVRKDAWMYLVGGFAPIAEYEKISDTFGKCADSLRIGPRPYVPGRKLTAQEWAERYKESVVLVVGTRPDSPKASTGTGFVVRDDGYVLTNHHVIWNEAKNEPWPEFYLHWDASLKRKPVRAKLIGWKRTNLMKRNHLDRIDEWGADTALLRIETPGAYKAMPIAPLTAAKLSDPVLTMGFPLTGTFDVKSLSLFVTRGVVVRFNRDVTGKVDSIFIDAKITHGNSGGPCVDLATGAVIGQNTFGYDVMTEGPQKLRSTLNDLVGYRGVIPIEHALNEFPEFMRLQPGFDRGWNAQDHFLLALDFLGQGSVTAASRQLEQAIEADSRHADAHALHAVCALRAGDGPKFFERMDNALRLDPEHYQALVLLAQVHGAQDEYAKASQYVDRAVKAQPKSPAPYLARGALMLAVKRFDEALEDADKAVELSYRLSPDPDVLAGRTLYAMGRLEDGRDRMKRALGASADNLDALLGYASYFERKELWEAAVIEYAKIGARLPNAPEADEALGRCYTQLKNHAKAFGAYRAAAEKCRDVGRVIPESTFEGLAHLAFDVKGDLELARPVLVDYVNTHTASPNANIRMAELHAAGGKLPGLAFAHALLARMTAQGDAEIVGRAARIPEAPLRLDDVLAMDEMGYLFAAVAVAQVAPLGFQLDEAKLRQLQGKLTPVVGIVFQIVLERQQRGQTGPGGTAPPPERGGDRPPPDRPRQDTPPQPPAQNNDAKVWRHPDGSMLVTYPGFTPQPQLVTRSHEQGNTFLRFIAHHRQSGTFLSAYGFAAGVRDTRQAVSMIQKSEANSGGKLEVTGQQEVTFGQLKGVLLAGKLGLRSGKAFAWEAVLVPTRSGVRGIQFLTPQQVAEQTEKLRRTVYQGLRIADVAPAGGGAATPPPPDRTPAPGGDAPVPPPGGGETPPPRDNTPPPTGGPEDQPPVPDGRPDPGAGRGPTPPPDQGKTPRALRSWRDAPSGIQLTYPRTFEPNPDRLMTVQNNGYGYVRFVAENRQENAEIMVFGFSTTVNTTALALQRLHAFAQASGVRMQAGAPRRIRFGSGQADVVAGATRAPNGASMAYELLLVPTPSGVRAVMLGSYQGGMARLERVRDQVFNGFRVGGAGAGAPPAAGGGDTDVFRAPSGTMEVRHPRSYVPNREAMANYRKNGVRFIELLAIDRRMGADFMVLNFAGVAKTGQAFQALQRFEASGGARMQASGEQSVRIGRRTGTKVHGTLTLQNGANLRWEGIFVPTRGGVRAVVYFVAQERFSKTAAHRKLIVDGFKVLK